MGKQTGALAVADAGSLGAPTCAEGNSKRRRPRAYVHRAIGTHRAGATTHLSLRECSGRVRLALASRYKYRCLVLVLDHKDEAR